MNSASNDNTRRKPLIIYVVEFLIGAAFAAAAFCLVAGGGQ